jgi:hypothetical protein
VTPHNSLIFGKDKAVADWVARKVPDAGSGYGDDARAVAVCVGDRPVAGVVYHNYNKACGTIHVSIASVSPLWAKRSTLLDLYGIPFLQYGCRKVLLITASDNVKAIRLAQHIGMVCEAKLRHQFGPKRAGWVFGMMRNEYDALRERWTDTLEKEAA